MITSSIFETEINKHAGNRKSVFYLTDRWYSENTLVF
jgi:hypothetical protein